MSPDNRSALATVVMCCSLVGVTTDAIAQTSSASSTEQIACDRPEAWASRALREERFAWNSSKGPR